MSVKGWSVFVCTAALTVACNGKSADRSSSPSDRDDQPSTSITAGTSGQLAAEQGTAASSGDARDFAQHAMVAGNAEVKLGQLAAQKAKSPAVKQFAQMMVRDHTKAGNELKQAVKGENVDTTPALDAKHQELYDRLSKLSGAEFDREYMSAMVDGHRDVKSMLESRADHSHGTRATGTTGTAGSDGRLDTAVNQWASKALPTVEQHLQKAEQIKNGLK